MILFGKYSPFYRRDYEYCVRVSVENERVPSSVQLRYGVEFPVRVTGSIRDCLTRGFDTRARTGCCAWFHVLWLETVQVVRASV